MSIAQPSLHPAPAEPAGPGPGLLLLIAAASAFGPLSTLMMIPALPEIRDEFSATNAASQAVISVFLFTLALGIPLAGPLSDRFGRRPIMLGGLAIVMAGSMLATFAPTLEILVLARAIQAIGCAANTTVARAMLGDIYSDWRLARALANLTLVMMVGTSLAPYLGGVLTESFSWHAPFVLLWGLSVIVLLIAVRGLPETRAWHKAVSNMAAVGRASMKIMGNRGFLSCVIDAGVIYALYLGFISTASYILGDSLDKPATDFGLYILLLSSGYFLGNLYVSRLKGHAALENVARFGTILQAASACLACAFVLAGFTDPLFWFGPMFPLAFAQGLVLPHVIATAVRMAPGFAGVASGMIGFSQQAIAALAVQAMGFLPTDTPVPVMAFCAILSLISLAFMVLLKSVVTPKNAA